MSGNQISFKKRKANYVKISIIGSKYMYSFIALHGRFGEDGYIQSVLDILGIRYTHSGVTTQAIR